MSVTAESPLVVETVAGLSVEDLAAQYGTPLYVYDAAVIAAQTRDELISIGQPLIAETVFSHPSKIDFVAMARARGYEIILV